MARFSVAQEEAIGESTGSLNVWYGSVSSGKTTAWLMLMIGEIINSGPSGALVIMGKTLDAVWQNVFIPLLTEPMFEDIAPHVSYRQRQPVARILGREVLVIGVNDVGAEGRIRGATFQKVFYDELTLCPEPVFNMLWSRMRAPGLPTNPTPPRIFATTNPDSSGHWLKERFIDRQEATDTYSRLFTMADNPGLSPDYVKRVEASYSGLFYQRFILGLWVSAEGAIYEGWDPSTMVVSELPKIAQVLSMGIDYGTQNSTAGVVIGVGEDRKLYAISEWAPNPGGKRMTDAQLADSLERFLDDLDEKGMRPRFIYVDPSAASFREELHHRGVTTSKADNDVVNGIMTVDSLLSNGQLIIHDSCKHLIREIPGYRWDEKAAKRGEDKPVKEDDHFSDGLRYSLRSSRHLWRKRIS